VDCERGEVREEFKEFEELQEFKEKESRRERRESRKVVGIRSGACLPAAAGQGAKR
jgi:hypothetical protein